MWFERRYRTRGIECGPDRWITLPAVMSLMETLRWEWLQDPALGLVDAVHSGHGFFVTEQQVELARRFSQGIDCRAVAALRRVGRVEARAEQALVDADGCLLASCAIRGVWTSPGGKLARIPKVARESVDDRPFSFPTGISRPGVTTSLFDPPSPLRDCDTPLPEFLDASIAREHPHVVHVRASDIDVFHHVNASNYLKFVADALASHGRSASIYRARMQFIEQARAGDVLAVYLQPHGDDSWSAEIVREGTRIFRAVVQTELKVPEAPTASP